MGIEGAVEELQKLLQTLNESKQFKYSAEITTNAKGEMQISAKVRGDDLVIVKSEHAGLVEEVIAIGNRNHLRLPERKI